MSLFGDLDLGGVPDLEALRGTDELLDRLARREPGPRDLDDPVVAALAVLAGDVDLAPVPVRLTERALAAVGLWPLPSVWGAAEPEDHESSGWARTLLPTEVGISAPRPAPAGETTVLPPHPEPLRRPRRAARPRPQLDHPRVLRLRPRTGVAAAAALVLIGCGMSVAVGNDSLNPLTGLTGVVGHWTDHRTDQQRQAQKKLSEKLQKAKDLVDAGQGPAAAQLLVEVQGQMTTLDSEDRKKIAGQVAEVQESLPPDIAQSGSTGIAGGPLDAASTGGGASVGGTVAGTDPASSYGVPSTVTSRSGWAAHPTAGPASVVAGQPAKVAAPRPPRSSDQHDERVRPTRPASSSTGPSSQPTTSSTSETTTTTTTTTATETTATSSSTVEVTTSPSSDSASVPVPAAALSVSDSVAAS